MAPLFKTAPNHHLSPADPFTVVKEDIKQVDALYQEIYRQQVDFNLQYLHDSIKRQHRFFSFLNVASVNFRDLIEARIIADFFASLFPDPERARLGVMELLFNAIEHGNLGITSEEKQDLLASGEWMNEIIARLDQPQYQNRRVHAYCYRDVRQVKLTIRDEGSGFNWRRVLDNAHLIPPTQYNGRGIIMAKALCFDELHYNETGNTVHAIQHRW